MKESESKWNIQGSRVYGDGHSFNCTNKITAKELQGILNNYETIKTEYKKTTKKLDQITRDIIRMNITLSTVHEELQQIRKGLEQ